MSMTRSWHEEELLNDLASPIAAGLVRIDEDSGPWVERLTKVWPWVDIRIDWSAVPGHRHLPAPPGRADSNFTLEEPATELRRFWSQARRELRIADDAEICVLGDAQVDFVLRLPARVFTEHLVDIFSIPQHSYVFPADLAWCFHYAIQDDAYFGRRPVKG